MKFSMVIPVHNEAANLERLISGFLGSLPAPATEALGEVILVENGSTDATRQVAESLVARFPGLVRLETVPRGSYGEAIKKGMLSATGTHVVIMECDVLDPQFLHDSIRLCREKKARFIVASKQHRDSHDGRPWKRRMMTRGFNTLLYALTGYPGSDTHGLKSIDAALSKELCGLAVTTDEVFQTEIVLLAWRTGTDIHELPLDIVEVRATPVRVMKRVPKVWPILWELRRSLQRLPADGRPGRVRAENRQTTAT